MYKKFDQEGEPELGLNESSDISFLTCLKFIRFSISGTLISGGLVALGIQKNNDSLVGMGMTVACIHVLRTLEETRKLMTNQHFE
jgi:hypothetical protein